MAPMQVRKIWHGLDAEWRKKMLTALLVVLAACSLDAASKIGEALFMPMRHPRRWCVYMVKLVFEACVDV